MQGENEKTIGERIVRTSFNPSDQSNVQHIKERGAEFINYVYENVNVFHCDAAKNEESALLRQKAIDAIELAVMYGVKAATV
jgi:hypothetical protein